MIKEITKKIRANLILGFCLAGALICQSSSMQVGNKSHDRQFPKAAAPGKTFPSDSRTPLTVHLSMASLPRPGEATEVTCAVSTVVDVEDVTASVQLPDDVVVINGSTNWNGALYVGQSVSFSATIIFQTGGKKIVRGTVKHVIDQDNAWGDLETLYLNIGALKTAEGFFSPEETNEINKAETAPLPLSEDQSVSPLALQYVDKGAEVPPALGVSNDDHLLPRAPVVAAAGTLTVTGKWSHYGRNGSLIPSKNFLVQLRRASDGGHLAFAYTDDSGNFSLGPVTNPGSAGVKVRIWTYVKYDSTDATGDELMVIPNGSTSNYANTYHGDTSTTYVFGDGTNSVGGWTILRDSPEGSQPTAHAWYIKDDLDRGWRYPLPSNVGDSTVEWQFDSTVGTFYRPGEHIHLMGDDRKSPDTVVHE